MSKQLIRNGGFERGDTEFWDSVDVLSIEALVAAKKYGTYGCKVISDGSASALIFPKDFFQVEYKELYNISLWIKNSVAHAVSVRIYEYDSDKQYVSCTTLETKTVGSTFECLDNYYAVNPGVSYIKLYIKHIAFSVTEYSYIDSVSVVSIDVSKISTTYESLIEIMNETTKHTVTGDEFFTGIWKEAEYFFHLSSFTETGGASAVTIDVKIQSLDPETGNWHDVMVFQQKSCPASGSVTTEEGKRLTGNLGWKQRLSYTTAGAGTIGDCDFIAGAVYKR